jgi:hypothetical protein
MIFLFRIPAEFVQATKPSFDIPLPTPYTASYGVVIPTVPAPITSTSVASTQVQTDWNATTGLAVLLNKPTLARSATIDTTNAGNITSGTIEATLLPLATDDSPGAVEPDGSTIVVVNGKITSVGASSIETVGGDLSGTLPNPTVVTIDGVTPGNIISHNAADFDTAGAAAAAVATLATVATTGSYSDLSNKPTIPAAQVNSDWTAGSGVAQILNKPTIPAAQVQTDWNSGSGVTEILNKPTIPAAQVETDWNATTGLGVLLNKPTIPTQVNSDWNASSGVAEILNKPTIPAAQVNSDWSAGSGVAQILNKPTIPAGQVQTDWNAVTGIGVLLNKPTIPAAQVNSDWNATTGLALILNKPALGAGSLVSYDGGSAFTTTNSYPLDLDMGASA